MSLDALFFLLSGAAYGSTPRHVRAVEPVVAVGPLCDIETTIVGSAAGGAGF